MTKDDVLTSVQKCVRETLQNDGSGHDWYHALRVRNTALRLAREEHADEFVVELAALLHDIADWKTCDGDETVGPRKTKEILTSQGVEEQIIDHVASIIATLSFKGAGVNTPMTTLEGQIVQDADRLDAMGAIGIARTFAYGGSKGRLIYDPEVKPTLHTNKEAYLNDNGHTINHFYEKLLLLKDRMNTKTAKKLAEGRHAFMEEYLNHFFEEWQGKI
jgi:uncharacterized protein